MSGLPPLHREQRFSSFITSQPYAAGGLAVVDDIELRCCAHNQDESGSSSESLSTCASSRCVTQALAH